MGLNEMAIPRAMMGLGGEKFQMYHVFFERNTNDSSLPFLSHFYFLLFSFVSSGKKIPCGYEKKVFSCQYFAISSKRDSKLTLEELGSFYGDVMDIPEKGLEKLWMENGKTVDAYISRYVV